MTERTIGLPYCRLSGVKNDPLSPHIQLKRILEKIPKLGVTCDPRRYTDGGDAYIDDAKGKHSARTRDNLPAWDALYERCKSDPRILYVVANDMSRAFRSTRAMLEHADALWEIGIKLYLVKTGLVDVATADGRRRAIDDANAAEYESRKTSERLKEHYAELKAQGIFVGHRDRYGLRRVNGEDDERDATWEPTDDFPTIVKYLELYATGKYGSPTLCRMMQAEGITWVNPANQRSHPRPTAFRLLLKNIDYYVPFLDPVLVERVRQVAANRSNRQENGRAPSTHPPPLLARALYCVCGDRFETNIETYYLKDGTKSVYEAMIHPYRSPCQARPLRYRTLALNQEFFHLLEQFSYDTSQREQILSAYKPPAPPPLLAPRPPSTDVVQLATLYAEGKLSSEQLQFRLDALKAAPPPPIPTAPDFLLSSEQVEERLRQMPSLVKALLVSAEVEPHEANRTVRNLFEVVVLAGRIQRIVLKNTGGQVMLYSV